MQFLSQEAFQRARSFVMDQGQRLDQRLWAFHFESGARGDVLAALATYQNEDGGFCKIEPDIQTEASSALAT
ncbi:MAG: hypothetical protein O2954_18715, partial [bacterium]|nr:hypothetical protein [bacterium]